MHITHKQHTFTSRRHIRIAAISFIHVIIWLFGRCFWLRFGRGFYLIGAFSVRTKGKKRKCAWGKAAQPTELIDHYNHNLPRCVVTDKKGTPRASDEHASSHAATQVGCALINHLYNRKSDGNLCWKNTSGSIAVELSKVRQLLTCLYRSHARPGVQELFLKV